MTDQPRRCSTCGTLTTELDKVCAGCGVSLHMPAGVTDSATFQPPHAQASPASGENPATASTNELAPTETPQEASNIAGARQTALPFAAAYMLNSARRRGLTGRVALAIGIGVIVAAAGTIAAVAMFSGHKPSPSASGNTQLTLATDPNTTTLEPTTTTTPVTEAVTTPTTAAAPTTPAVTTGPAVTQPATVALSIPKPVWNELEQDNAPLMLVAASLTPGSVSFGQKVTFTFQATASGEEGTERRILQSAEVSIYNGSREVSCRKSASLVTGTNLDGTYRASCTIPAGGDNLAGTFQVDIGLHDQWSGLVVFHLDAGLTVQ